MGLAFIVGNPSDVFTDQYAKRVRNRLVEVFGSAIVLDSSEPPYSTDELGWSGWAELQERASATVGAERVPHLLSMEAWSGGYVPAPTEPTEFTIEGQPTPLAVGSLPALVAELEAVGAALGLATDDDGLSELAARFDDDDAVDDDMDIQTYTQLLRAAHVAERRQQVLWVVK